MVIRPMVFLFSSLLQTRKAMDGRRVLYTVVTMPIPRVSTQIIGTRRTLYVYYCC